MRFPGFIGPAYTLASLNVDCQECINLYLEVDELGTGKLGEPSSLVATPGLSLVSAIGTGPIRAMKVAGDGLLYVVSGSKLYRVTSAGVATHLADLQTATGFISIADNGIQLGMIDPLQAYTWNYATNTFTSFIIGDFGGGLQVTYQDGYFIYLKEDAKFYVSAYGDGSDVQPLDYATAEGSPDNGVGIISVNRTLYVLGTNSVEAYVNSGDPDFPFQRIQGGTGEYGCVSAASIAKIDNTMFWLGQDERGAGVVFMSQGLTPFRISNQGIENAIKSYTLASATAYTYQEAGHVFYVLNFPEGTWVYDISTKTWHRRAAWDGANWLRHRINTHAFVYGAHYVGDYQNGNLYKMSLDYLTDNGTYIRRCRTSPHYGEEMRRMSFPRVHMDMQVAVGLDGTGQGTDPQVMLQWSDDGGYSWSNEKWQSAGMIGDRLRRVIWTMCGSGRDRVWRVVISDPVTVRIISLLGQVS